MEKLRNLRRAIGYVLLFLAVQFACSLVASIGAQVYFQTTASDRAAELYDAFASDYSTVILLSSQVLTILIIMVLAKLRGMPLWVRLLLLLLQLKQRLPQQRGPTRLPRQTPCSTRASRPRHAPSRRALFQVMMRKPMVTTKKKKKKKKKKKVKERRKRKIVP